MKIIPPTLPEPAPRLTGPLPARIVPCAAPPPDAADEDFADGSVEMNGDGSQLRVALALQAAQPLTMDRTIYVDSVAGNDGNAGTQAAPFKTFDRAWQERQKYGVLRAKFAIRLLGVGPYALPARLGLSLADVGGYLIIRGDEAAEVTHYTGTFTSDLSVGNIAVDGGGLGADTHKNRYVKITSGAANGCVFMVLKHTDTQITVCSGDFKVAGAFNLNGATFKVFTPGTAVTSNSTRVEEWRGGDPIGGTTDPRHVFLNLAITGSIGALNSNVAYLVCTSTSAYSWYYSTIQAGIWIDATLLGAPTPHAYRAAGLSATSATMISSNVRAIYSASNPAGVTLLNLNTVMDHYGGRLAGEVYTSGTGNNYRLSAGAKQEGYRFEKTVTIESGCTWTWFHAASLVEWAVTSGSCVRVKQGAQLVWRPAGGTAASGGTSDPAGYAIDCTGGGKAFTTFAPAITGGTAGKDLKTSNNGGVASSVLSAAGTVAGVAADALLGEVIARI